MHNKGVQIIHERFGELKMVPEVFKYVNDHNDHNHRFFVYIVQKIVNKADQ